ncbi:MAG: hypothetical protein NVSMB19_04960 [Vulcanimicrobiaceae bacterium]
MAPLDLTQAPPRPPRAELAGIMFLPRSIDKVRASLPGGKLGDYAIAGFTETMLTMFGIELADFTEVVRTAASDDDVAAFVTPRVAADAVARWHAYALARKPRGGNRDEAIAAYPFLAGRADLGASVDVLAEDDERSFRR